MSMTVMGRTEETYRMFSKFAHDGFKGLFIIRHEGIELLVLL